MGALTGQLTRKPSPAPNNPMTWPPEPRPGSGGHMVRMHARRPPIDSLVLTKQPLADLAGFLIHAPGDGVWSGPPDPVFSAIFSWRIGQHQQVHVSGSGAGTP